MQIACGLEPALVQAEAHAARLDPVNAQRDQGAPRVGVFHGIGRFEQAGQVDVRPQRGSVGVDHLGHQGPHGRRSRLELALGHLDGALARVPGRAQHEPAAHQAPAVLDNHWNRLCFLSAKAALSPSVQRMVR